MLLHLQIRGGLHSALYTWLDYFETLLCHFDGRNSTPGNLWKDTLYWGHFVGANHGFRLIDARCGRPRQAVTDFNRRELQGKVMSDIQDWRPEGGKRRAVTHETFRTLGWPMFWMQSIPGRGASLYFRGKGLRNWWYFPANFDEACRRSCALTY